MWSWRTWGAFAWTWLLIALWLFGAFVVISIGWSAARTHSLIQAAFAVGFFSAAGLGWLGVQAKGWVDYSLARAQADEEVSNAS